MKFIIYTILFSGWLTSFGQGPSGPICDCCTHSMFQFQNDYDRVFTPTTVKASGVRELTIYAKSLNRMGPHDTNYQTIDSAYKEMIFHFNNDGFVLTQILFHKRGAYHSMFEFTRDTNNKVLTKTAYYLDKIGKKIENLYPQKWLYVYSDNQLIKVKKLGDKFLELPDSKSDYTRYSYDGKGRVILEESQWYHDREGALIARIHIAYDDSANMSTRTTTTEKNHVASTITTRYTENKKPINEKFFGGVHRVLLTEKSFAYNANEQLIRYESKNYGRHTGCPDGENFVNDIVYSSKNLFEKIFHRFENTICELDFRYR